MKMLWTLTLLFTLGTLNTASAQNGPSDGLYSVSGQHSGQGTYVGQAWVSGGRTQRLIEWKSLRYRGYKVQSIWDGSWSENAPRFVLQLSTVLTSFEDFKPSPAEINAKIPVNAKRLSDQNPAGQSASTPISARWSFDVANEGHYEETWTLVGPASSGPLWVNERKMTEGLGKNAPLTVQIARLLGINKAIAWYRNSPETEPYRNRPEYRDQKQYMIRDITDARFYTAHPDTLRLANRTLNPLAFAEALMRRNAYGRPLRDKADELLNETLTYNLNSEGMLEYATVDASGRKIARQPDYDSSLWSAMFAWAEALRYENTKDPVALEHFKQVLNGILTLVEITDDPKQFARNLAIASPNENLGEGYVQGKGRFAHLQYRKGGNNDMLKGLLITLALAHKLPLNLDPAVKARVVRVAQMLPNLEVARDGDRNEAAANGVAALWTGDAKYLDAYYARNNGLKSTLASAFNIGAGFYYGGIADWSGVHLSMVSTISEIIIAKELESVFPSGNAPGKLQRLRQKSEGDLFAMQKTYRPAGRDFLTLMTYAYSSAARSTPGFKDQALEATWTLKEVPAPRFIGAGTVDLPLRADWSLSAWPRVPWKALDGVFKMKSDLEFRNFASGVYSYPHFETNAWNSVYLWKDSAFSVNFVATPERRLFSADYLLLYWASNSAGLVL